MIIMADSWNQKKQKQDRKSSVYKELNFTISVNFHVTMKLILNVR